MYNVTLSPDMNFQVLVMANVSNAVKEWFLCEKENPR